MEIFGALVAGGESSPDNRKMRELPLLLADLNAAEYKVLAQHLMLAEIGRCHAMPSLIRSQRGGAESGQGENKRERPISVS